MNFLMNKLFLKKREQIRDVRYTLTYKSRQSIKMSNFKKQFQRYIISSSQITRLQMVDNNITVQSNQCPINQEHQLYEHYYQR